MIILRVGSPKNVIEDRNLRKRSDCGSRIATAKARAAVSELSDFWNRMKIEYSPIET